jgi:hypothetical protein
MRAKLISKETARADNAIILDYLTTLGVLVEHENESTDSNIPIDNICTDDEQHFGMPGGYEDCGYITRECYDWTVYFSPVKYRNAEANATPS